MACEIIVVNGQVTEPIEIVDLQTLVIRDTPDTLQIVDLSTSIQVLNQPTIIEVIDPAPTEVIEVCKVGPPGPSGVVTQTDTLVDAGTTEVIYINLASFIRAVKWTVTSRDDTLDLIRAVEIIGMNKAGVTSFSVYGAVGDPISYTLALAVVGINLELSMSNTGANDLKVSVHSLETIAW